MEPPHEIIFRFNNILGGMPARSLILKDRDTDAILLSRTFTGPEIIRHWAMADFHIAEKYVFNRLIAVHIIKLYL